MSIIKSFKEFNPLPTNCVQCRQERGRLCKFDKKKPDINLKPIHSNIIPGFYSKEQITKSERRVDLLILAESHGGDISFFREQWTTLQEIKFISDFYLNGNKTFHQQQIKALINWLDKKDISWYFTDLVKCYVKKVSTKKKDNFKIAIENCDFYLNQQLKKINPKMVLCLGKIVYEAKTGQKLIGSVEDNHGGYKSKILFSCFPSRNTADLWVKIGGWKKVQRRIIEVLVKTA